MSEVGFNEDEYDALRERETLVSDLTESPGWQAILELGTAQIDSLKRRLLSGQIPSHEEYLKVTWQIRGAEWVLRLPAEIHGIVDEYRRQIAERQEAERE